jgi:hypothetical protein
MELSTPAASAIPHEQFLKNLQQYCFGERMVPILQREPAFGELKYRLHQIYFVHDFALRNDDQGLPVHQLSRAFGHDGGRVKAALDNGLNDRKVRDRHFTWDDDSEIEILEWVQTQAENMCQSHGQTFDIPAKSNVPGLFLEDGLILSFCATERI